MSKYQRRSRTVRTRLRSLDASETLVLIGPAGAGKSSVGARVAALLHRPFVDLDGVGDTYYAEIDQSLDTFQAVMAANGVVDAHRWWQPARAHGVERVLDEHAGAVIALGAGHSHFEDVHYFDVVCAALALATVVLLLPCQDVRAAITTLRARCERDRGISWVIGSVDFLSDWVTSIQNHALAHHIVYADGDDIEAVSRRVVRLVANR
jgi:predicted Ser/Thr protein kinase